MHPDPVAGLPVKFLHFIRLINDYFTLRYELKFIRDYSETAEIRGWIMNLLSRIPIRFLLILIVMIVALPAAGIIINAGLQQRNEALAVARKDTQIVAERIAYEQQGMVASARQLMVSLSQVPEIKRKDAVKVTALLREILKLNPDITNIFVADRSGTVWASALPITPPFVISDRRYFKNALASGQLSSGEYVVSRVTNRPTFNLSYPVKDEHGVVAVVIAVGFSLEKYTRFLERSKLPDDASFALLDHKGVFLFRAVEPEKFIGKRSDPELFKKVQEAPDESTLVGTAMSTGDERIISTRKLRLQGEQTPYMYVRVGIPVESALASANSQLLKNLLFFSCILVLAMLFSAFVGNRSIVSRIAVLEKASQSLANGDYQIKVNDLVKGGELGRLAESFDTMANKLVQRGEALASSERFLKAIIDTEPECIKMLDADGNLLMMNRAGLEMIQADSFEQVKGTCICPLVTSPYKDAFFALVRQVFQGIPGTLEFETIGLKGRHVWLETHAVPFCNEQEEIIALLGITRNITARKLAEQALNESEDRFRLFVENANDIVFSISKEGVFTYVSPNWTDAFGYELAETIGKPFVPFVHPDDVAGCFAFLQLVLETGEKQSGVEYRVLHKNGSYLWYSANGSLLHDPRNGEVSFLGIGRDVTERKRAEEERDLLERQLLHAQKLESLGVLAGGIAHDFNNILMAIIGNADLALMRINRESPATENLHRIEKAAARAADLAKQMLAYSGKGKFVVENIDLNTLLKDMLHMLEVSISKKAVLRLNLHQHLPTVEADATQMRQIVMNLVINASEAIGEKSGVIAIATGCMDCDKNYLKNVWLDENISSGLYVYLEIADTGCGMNKETMAKLFDPFYTTKFTGRGLGMAAVLGIVRGHKGAIKVYSEPGKGTTFKVLFPASNRPPEIFSGESGGDDWRGNGTILLVDDEETVRGIGKEMLLELGFSAITANDGREAVEVFKTIPDIALVILDLTMPHMDGEQCFRELRQLKPDVKVMMSSGYNEQEVTQKFAGKGLAGFIQKPYRLSVLKETIMGILRT